MHEETLHDEFEKMITEGRSPYVDLDTLPVEEILKVMNAEDARVPGAVAREIPRIAQAVECIVDSFRSGGRLFYVGAGTSGRLGVLDASECPPTFGTDPEMVQGVIAGGIPALYSSIEEVEDDPEAGAWDMTARGVDEKDTVVGIAASGRTPYVLGAVREARRRGAKTVGLSCNPDGPLQKEVHIAITPVVGPEVLAGSTRMKAGTAEKLVLNMLSSAAMIRLGKVYSNLMVDVLPSNVKLIRRATRIVRQATGCSPEEAEKALKEAGGKAKVAIVAILGKVDAARARELLEQEGGYVRNAVRRAACLQSESGMK